MTPDEALDVRLRHHLAEAPNHVAGCARAEAEMIDLGALAPDAQIAVARAYARIGPGDKEAGGQAGSLTTRKDEPPLATGAATSMSVQPYTPPSPAFCIDCDHDHMPGDEILSLTPADGWAAEFARPADADEDSPEITVSKDGSRWFTWIEPVIGWAVVRDHYQRPGRTLAHESRVEPVLLADGEAPEPMSTYTAGMKRVHVRIIRQGGQA